MKKNKTTFKRTNWREYGYDPLLEEFRQYMAEDDMLIAAVSIEMLVKHWENGDPTGFEVAFREWKQNNSLDCESDEE